jgi:ribosomal protein S18 acetylase RimI-like enzyme
MDAAALAIRRAAETPVQATRTDLAACAADLSSAFSDYVMFTWFMRTDARRDAARDRLFNLILRDMVFDTGTIMRPSTGGAAAVWMRSDQLGPNPLWKELRAIPTIVGATGIGPRLLRLAAMREGLDKHHPMDRPHAYLFLLGVHQRLQGLGIGSRLLAAGLAKVDAERLPCFLETSSESSMALYRRHGFEVTSDYFVAKDSPPTWTMWREPQD